MNSIREAALLLRDLPWEVQETFAREFDDHELAAVVNCWQSLARPNQLRPAGCRPIWFRRCGRGEGKTRSGAERTLDLMEDWGPAYRGILLNKTYGDCKKISIKGDAGLIACAQRRGYSLRFNHADGIVYHPKGGQAFVATPEKPDSPRGFRCNHFWGDEISSWQHALETWSNLMWAWQLKAPEGHEPEGTVTSTPKSNAITRLLLKGDFADVTTVTGGRTADNYANLSEQARRTVDLYQGTRLGRQEGEGEFLDENGATFEQDTIHAFRVRRAPDLYRRVVSVDPSINSKETSDDAGVAVIGCDDQSPAEAYVLDVYAVGSHREWPHRAVASAIEYDCSEILVEVNQGGTWVVDAIASAAEAAGLHRHHFAITEITSTKSKADRAVPVGAVYERGLAHHVGHFLEAEKELTSWVPGMPSPNMMDAIVQGITHLLFADTPGPLGAYLK